MEYKIYKEENKMRMKELFEAADYDEYNDEGQMIKNDLHTIVRVSSHLQRALHDDENLPTWVIEKIAQSKGMIVSVMDYMISSHEQQDGDRLDQGPAPDTNESATGGATSTADMGANTAVAPRAKQKKTKYGTAKNALDSDSIFARPARR